MLFGDVNNPYLQEPTTINFDSLTGKVSFFLGDRWIPIGEMKTIIENKNVYVRMPNIEGFFESRQYLNDGTAEWAMWGPRVN